MFEMMPGNGFSFFWLSDLYYVRPRGNEKMEKETISDAIKYKNYVFHKTWFIIGIFRYSWIIMSGLAMTSSQV